MALAGGRSQSGKPRNGLSGVPEVSGFQSSGGHGAGDWGRSWACGALSPWSGRCVTGGANRDFAVALGTPMKMVREQPGALDAGVAGLCRKST